MNHSEVLELTERSLKDLNETLKQGNSEGLTAFLRSASLFPQYSYRNLFLIQRQNPNATRIAGFRAWRELGRWVKQDEKSIKIIAPLIIRLKPESPEDEKLAFRVAHVFDISQTEGQDLPEFTEAKGDPRSNLETLEKVFSNLGIYVESFPMPRGRIGVSTGGRVAVSDSLSVAARFQTLVHELAHELLHQQLGSKEDKVSMEVEELEAEAIAYVISLANGVDCKEASADYIRLYKGDEQLLAQSLDRIRKTSLRIFDLLDVARQEKE